MNAVQNHFHPNNHANTHRPLSIRDRPSFQHRLLIRISTDTIHNTLTITDLGSGMTRSDVINSLGAGSRLSQKAIHAARVIDGGNANRNRGEKESMMDMGNHASDDYDDDDDDEDDDSTCSEEDSVISSTSDESGNDAANDIAGIDINAALNGGDGRESDRKVIRVPAQAKDIGSFYAAICALGEEVEIGTKVSEDLGRFS
jgi:hypothetical protein